VIVHPNFLLALFFACFFCISIIIKKEEKKKRTRPTGKKQHQ